MCLQWGGVQIRVGFCFFLVLALFFALDQSGTGFLMISAVFLHEFGHICALFRLKLPVKEIRFTPFGVRIVRPTGPDSGTKEALVYLAGPLTNLAVAALCTFGGDSPGLWCRVFWAVNLVMAGFNLLPIACLDGGNALRLQLCAHLKESAAQAVSAGVSALVLAPLFALALVLLCRRKNFTLLLTCVYLTALLVRRQE